MAEARLVVPVSAAARTAKMRDKESESHRLARLARDRERQRRKRATMSAQQRMQVAEAERLRRARLRATESPEQAAQRRKIARIKTAERRARKKRAAAMARDNGRRKESEERTSALAEGEAHKSMLEGGPSVTPHRQKSLADGNLVTEHNPMAEGGAAVWKQVTSLTYTAIQKQTEAEPQSDGAPDVGYSAPTNRNHRSAASSDVIVLSDEDSSASVSPNSPINAPQEGSPADVTQIRELLEQEESKLRRLKQLRVIQSPLHAPVGDSDPDSPEESRTTVRGGGKANIVVVPGNQSQKPSSTGTGISSRLQHIVDSIAVDQSICPPRKPSGASKTLPPSLTPSHPTSTALLKQQTVGLINKSLSHLSQSSVSRGKATGKDVITITDSPSPISTKSPPPLLPTPLITSSSGKSSVQVSSVSSSSSDPQPPSLRPIDPDQEKTIMAAVENSKRYRDYLAKHLLAKRSFQKQIERKIAVAPYPKTFRQVWPVIPVYDASFVRNYGLEAILQHFDSSLNSAPDKAGGNSKVKPICNQCGCDFASAWQIRKSNSKQLLLCEACDFANLKILQRSKLANQLRELLSSVDKERDQFKTECEEARKQVVSVEKQLIVAMTQQQQQQQPPPLFSQRKHMAGSGLSLPNASTLTNHVFNATNSSVGKASGATVLVSSSPAVIPSILPTLPSRGAGGAGETSRKRKDPGNSSGHGPPGKSLKLDQTLDKLSKALLERKLDEQRQERKASQKAGRPEDREAEVAGNSADSRKSKRKGTPRHKRHLSSSSP